MALPLKYIPFRIFGIKASVGEGLLNLGWKLQPRDSTHDQFLSIICYSTGVNTRLLVSITCNYVSNVYRNYYSFIIIIIKGYFRIISKEC